MDNFELPNVEITNANYEVKRSLLRIFVHEGKKGLRYLDGEIILEPIFDDIAFAGEDLLILQKDDEYAVLNLRYPERGFGRYMWIGEFGDGMASVKQNELYGYIDINGRLVVPCIYSYTQKFQNGFGRVTDMDSKKRGAIDASGKLIIPTVFDGIDFVSKAYAITSRTVEKFPPHIMRRLNMPQTICFTDIKYGLYSKDGNELLPCEFIAIDKTDNPNIFAIHNNGGNCPVYLDGATGMIYPDLDMAAMVKSSGGFEYEKLDK
jgi:hypothetical protein